MRGGVGQGGVGWGIVGWGGVTKGQEGGVVVRFFSFVLNSLTDMMLCSLLLLFLEVFVALVYRGKRRRR